MTEPREDIPPVAEPVAVPVEAAPDAPAEAAADGEPGARTGRRRAPALIAAGVAVAVLAGGGVWALGALQGADRTATTRYWSADDTTTATPEPPAPVPANALSGKLLPVPDSFALGPDLADDGNNFFVSGDSAVQGFKDARKGLSGAERKKRDEALAELKLKGLAGRSYARPDGRLVVEVRIMQADPRALGTFSEVSKKLIEYIGKDQDAPKVDGFPDARCSVMALGEEKKESIESIDCVAVEGDVMVNFRAYGPKSLSRNDATQFLKNQLSHLKSPGESV
ncbi:hypothetical protein [Streptomyces sp. RerS4]|uniref:hypothetical protein n=1 Tax=Streptomyces sp. RerS4 TaxID=2942449 RepID=UPI00201C280A|nr:hypothetical protein [Streptomyces sp. RerS4]UQX02219.1 hypothetical protein M4D82_18300 [Streptomyces sp. RerS4]